MTRLQGKVAVLGVERQPQVAEIIRASPSVSVVPRGPNVDELILDTDPDLPEGSYCVDIGAESDKTIWRVTGDGFSGLVYGVHEVLGSRSPGSQPPDFEFGQHSFAPGLPYRLFWTWDHSTNWALDELGQQEVGFMSPYAKRPEAFLKDYKRVVDFASIHRIGGIVIYGLLRDTHGGLEAAAELCDYAIRRGVRIVLGVGINAYGGIFWEGDVDQNLAYWLNRHSGMRASIDLPRFIDQEDFGRCYFPRGDYAAVSNGDLPEVVQWHRDALGWALENLDLGGVNLEVGDYRGTSSYVDLFSDMMRAYPDMLDVVRTSARRSIWTIGELYYGEVLDASPLDVLRPWPHGLIGQFTFNASYWPQLKDGLGSKQVAALGLSQVILRTHMGSPWNRQRYEYLAPEFAQLASRAHSTGVDGVHIFGEVSPYSPPNEANYLAFSQFAYNPTASWADFWENELAPRYGGIDAAARFFTILEETKDRAFVTRQTLEEVTSYARDAAYEVSRRWAWLVDSLHRQLFLA